MFQKTLLVCFFINLASAQASVNELQTLLNDLSELVLGSIAVAHLQVENFVFDISAFYYNVELQAEFDLMEHDQRCRTQLMHIRWGWTESKVDIKPCFEGREEKIDDMVLQYYEQVDQCLLVAAAEAYQIKTDGLYTIDVIFTYVRQLEFQLSQCASNVECLSELSNNINKQVTDLPLRVTAEVKKVDESVQLLKAKMQRCGNTNVSNYAEEAFSIIHEIANCLNNLYS